MRKLLWAGLAALPLVVGGLVYAGSQANNKAEKPTQAKDGFVCPLTGDFQHFG